MERRYHDEGLPQVERRPYDEIPAQVKRRPYGGSRRRTGPEPVAKPEDLPRPRRHSTAGGFPGRFSQVRRMRPGAGTGTLAAFLVLALEACAMGA
jgi:hypothetical protein